MNRILSIILCCMFTIFSFFLLWGSVFAQQEVANVTWINLLNNCLTGMWKWCFDSEKMIWIDKVQNQNITTTSIAQDVLLSATYMVWKVLTVVIIYCWLRYIFAAKDWKDPKAYKDWLIDAAIWAILVRWAYTIVRLIQYIAWW